MKAIVYTQYGPPEVLRLEDVPKPEPGDREVLIEIRAASVNPIDWHFMRGTPYVMRLGSGLRSPAVTRLGIDVAGRIEAVGAKVTRLRPGDEVFGSCRGAFAQFACAPERGLVRKPANLTFEQAAAAPVAALSALQGLRDRGRVEKGQKVLVNGAAGGVGTFAVQIAREFGAEVTGVCSARNVDGVRSIGASHVLDYAREDFTESGRRYDVILDTVGNHSLSACRRALGPDGILVLVGGSAGGAWLGPLPGAIRAAVVSRFTRQKFRPFMAHVNAADLAILAELMGGGKVSPVIDRSYPLEEVPAAIRYLEAGHARGKVVISIGAGT